MASIQSGPSENSATLRNSLNALTDSFSDLTPELRDAAKVVADQWDANFSRTRDLLTPLAPLTLALRRARIARGVTPIDAEDTPLRFEHDSIRKAATDLSGGALGSGFGITKKDVTLGVDPGNGDAGYMADVLLGRPDRNIPPRGEVLTEGEAQSEAKVDAILDRAVELRLQRAALAG